MEKQRTIRAFHTDAFIRVYQAYNKDIAGSAVANQKFITPPFKLARTTWIKPSFFWMMYRCGWGHKENQERILAIDITHEGFLWALQNACLSHYESAVYESPQKWERIKNISPVVIQWDPERDMFLNKLDYRSIQIGLTPVAAKLYANDWIIKITDITELCENIHKFIKANKIHQYKSLLPIEMPYPLDNIVASKINAN